MTFYFREDYHISNFLYFYPISKLSSFIFILSAYDFKIVQIPKAGPGTIRI